MKPIFRTITNVSIVTFSLQLSTFFTVFNVLVIHPPRPLFLKGKNTDVYFKPNFFSIAIDYFFIFGVLGPVYTA